MALVRAQKCNLCTYSVLSTVTWRCWRNRSLTSLGWHLFLSSSVQVKGTPQNGFVVLGSSVLNQKTGKIINQKWKVQLKAEQTWKIILKITCHAHSYFLVAVHAKILKKTDGKFHYSSMCFIYNVIAVTQWGKTKVT